MKMDNSRGGKLWRFGQRRNVTLLEHEGTFKAEKEFLRLDSAGISHQRPVRPDHPVTGHNDRDRIRSVRTTNGLEATARAETLRKLSVGDRGSVGNLREFFPHAKLERRSEEIDGGVELRETPVEVAVQLIDGVTVLRLVVHDFVVVEILAQPAEKIPLALPRHTDFTDAFIRRSNVDQADL